MVAAKKFESPSEGAAEGGVGGIPPRPSIPPERSGGGHWGFSAKWVLTQGESNSHLCNVPIALVDPPGIEPGPRQCECRVMPFYYGPTKAIEDPF